LTASDGAALRVASNLSGDLMNAVKFELPAPIFYDDEL
jgi:hypothetical protein